MNPPHGNKENNQAAPLRGFCLGASRRFLRIRDAQVGLFVAGEVEFHGGRAEGFADGLQHRAGGGLDFILE